MRGWYDARPESTIAKPFGKTGGKHETLDACGVRGAAAGFGLMIAFVGQYPQLGVHRWTYGWLYLWDGLAFHDTVAELLSMPETIEALEHAFGGLEDGRAALRTLRRSSAWVAKDFSSPLSAAWCWRRSAQPGRELPTTGFCGIQGMPAVPL